MEVHFSNWITHCNSYLQLPWTTPYTQQLEAGKIDSVVIDEDASFLLTWSFSIIVILTIFVCLFEECVLLKQMFALRKLKKNGLSFELEANASRIDAEKEKNNIKSSVTKSRKSKSQEEKKSDEDLNDSSSDDDCDDNKDAKQGVSDDNDVNEKKKDDTRLLSQLTTKLDDNYRYNRHDIFYRMGVIAYTCAVEVFLMATADIAGCWDISTDLGMSWFGWNEREHEVQITVMYLFIFQIACVWVLELPIHFFKYKIDNNHFGMSEEHGSNIFAFFKERFKVLWWDSCRYLTFVVILTVWFRYYCGEYYHFQVLAITMVVSLHDDILAPFMNYTSKERKELPEGTLKKGIQTLATKTSLPLENVFVIDDEDDDSFVTVFGMLGAPKVILIQSQVLQGELSEKEVLALVGQEIAKWKMGHVWKRWAVTQAYYTIFVYMYYHFYTRMELYESFGVDDPERLPIPIIVQIMIFIQTIYIPCGKMLTLLYTSIEQSMIISADVYYCREFSAGTRDLQTGLCKLHLLHQNDSDNATSLISEMLVCPNSLYSSCYLSQPPLVQRCSNISQLEKKTQ